MTQEPDDNEELRRIFEADQDDRARSDWERMRSEDPKRRERVAALLDDGCVRTGSDFFHAAMVFQHGSDLSDYRRAQELALQAASLGRDDAKWLAAAAADRWLMVSGLPQKYGTQFRGEGGAWVVHEVDPATTDEDRVAVGVPTLAAQEERAKAMTRDNPPPLSASPFRPQREAQADGDDGDDGQ